MRLVLWLRTFSGLCLALASSRRIREASPMDVVALCRNEEVRGLNKGRCFLVLGGGRDGTGVGRTRGDILMSIFKHRCFALVYLRPMNAFFGLQSAVRRHQVFLAAVALTAALSKFLSRLLTEILLRISQTYLSRGPPWAYSPPCPWSWCSPCRSSSSARRLLPVPWTM